MSLRAQRPDGVTKPDDKVYIEGQNYTIETDPLEGKAGRSRVGVRMKPAQLSFPVRSPWEPSP